MRRRLLILTVFLLLGAAPVAATTLGKGRPPHPGFSGYVASDGSELGVGRLAGATWGICLDTGTKWKWPEHRPKSRIVLDPVVGYLTSVYLPRAAHDPALAAALWWAVGERLNSHPQRVTDHVERLGVETPRRGLGIAARRDRILADASAHAAPATGYAPPVITLSRTEVAGIGVLSAAGQWVPDLPVVVRLTNATLDSGGSVWSGRTTSEPLRLPVTASAPRLMRATVQIGEVPAASYQLFEPQHELRQRVASTTGRTTLSASAEAEFVPTQPSIITRAATTAATAGATVADHVTVAGIVPGGDPVPGEWRLLGPVAADSNRRCGEVVWDDAPVAGGGAFNVASNGTQVVGALRVRRGGCYTFQERLEATTTSLAAPWTAPGIVEETLLLRPPAVPVPQRPQVDSGGERSGTVGPNVASDRAVPSEVRVPKVGLLAGLGSVAFEGRTLTPPEDLARGARWSDGAAIDDVVGTIVLVGHVSDDHDQPGAFGRLQRTKVGMGVTLTQGATETRWRIAAIKRINREKLPRELFEQSVERRLVMITCTGRVDTAGGGFHYRQNLVVIAEPA